MAAVATQTYRDTTDLIWYLNLKLAALGQPTGDGTAEPGFLQIAQPLLRSYETKDRLLRDHLCPADTRIQTFLNDYLNGVAFRVFRGCPRALWCSTGPDWLA